VKVFGVMDLLPIVEDAVEFGRIRIHHVRHDGKVVPVRQKINKEIVVRVYGVNVMTKDIFHANLLLISFQLKIQLQYL